MYGTIYAGNTDLRLWDFGTLVPINICISFLRSSPAQELCDLGTLVTLKHLRIQYLWYLGTSGPFKLWHLPKYLGTSVPRYLGTSGPFQLWHMPYYNTFGTAGLWDLFNSDNFEIKIPSGLWYLGTLVPWYLGTLVP